MNRLIRLYGLLLTAALLGACTEPATSWQDKPVQPLQLEPSQESGTLKVVTRNGSTACSTVSHS